jgi:SAM-dependent methyltransferase
MAKRSRGDDSLSKGKISKEVSEKEKPGKKKKPSPTDESSKSAPSEDSPEKWSKSKKKRMRTMLGKQKNKEVVAVKPKEKNGGDEKSKEIDDSSAKPVRSSKLQDSFKARLSGSRFRILNEELYTTTSKESYDRFSSNPELFEQYHEGFRHQVESWPVNPLDVIVRGLATNVNKKKSCVVADFGCGDAQLAKELLDIKSQGKCPFKVHSFDLVSPNELVTACDMADIPLEDKSVDVCVFCLSLMGTNLADFIREAHRVLQDNGRVKIAEVRSRIEYSHREKGDNGKKETKAGTLEEFTDVLEELGFECVRTDRKNKMFLLLELKKSGKNPNKKLEFSAKPCIYKRR